MRNLQGLVDRRAPASVRRQYAAVVTESGPDGVSVTELEGDTAHPTEITWGAFYRDVSHCPAGAHDHPLVPIPKGTPVLAVETDHGVWLVAPDLASLPTT